MDWKTRAKELIFKQIDEMQCSDRKKKFLRLVDYTEQTEIMVELAKEAHKLAFEEQISRLNNIILCLTEDLQRESSDWGRGYHQCTKDVIQGLTYTVDELQEQLKSLQYGNN